MPAGDGTGPIGQGPMTGRGWGYCILEIDPRELGIAQGFAGLAGRPVVATVRDQETERKVIKMPAGNGTGPNGMGPMTGRGAGFCAGYPVPGYANPMPGRGFGFGRGRGSGRGLGMGFRGGRGWGGYGEFPPNAAAYPYGAASSPRQEADMLKGQAEYFEESLKGIKKRIAELESKSEEAK